MILKFLADLNAKKMIFLKKAAAAAMCLVFIFSFSLAARGEEEIPSLNDNLQTAGNAAKYAEVSQERSFLQLAEIIGSIIGAFLALVGVIFLGIMIYAGYLWMTANGNEDKVSKAKDMIRDSIIGIIIIIGAYAIVYFVLAAVSSYNENFSGFKN